MLCCASCKGIYYCYNMIMVALTSVVSVIIVYVSDHYQNQPVPLWARKVCNQSLVDFKQVFRPSKTNAET